MEVFCNGVRAFAAAFADMGKLGVATFVERSNAGRETEATTATCQVVHESVFFWRPRLKLSCRTYSDIVQGYISAFFPHLSY